MWSNLELYRRTEITRTTTLRRISTMSTFTQQHIHTQVNKIKLKKFSFFLSTNNFYTLFYSYCWCCCYLIFVFVCLFTFITIMWLPPLWSVRLTLLIQLCYHVSVFVCVCTSEPFEWKNSKKFKQQMLKDMVVVVRVFITVLYAKNIVNICKCTPTSKLYIVGITIKTVTKLFDIPGLKKFIFSFG